MASSPRKYTLLDQWKFMRIVASDPNLARCAVSCAFWLVDYFNERLDRAWPSYDTLAELTGSNRRTVITAVKRLVELEYFEVERGNGRRSNYYRPNIFPIINSIEQSDNSDASDTTVGTPAPPIQGVEVNSPSPYTSYVPVAPSVGDIEVSPHSAASSAPGGATSPSRGAHRQRLLATHLVPRIQA